MKNIKLFAYGTLKRGFINEVYLKHSSLLGIATTKHQYPMVNTEGHFPYLIKDKGYGKHIKGELYEIDDITLKMLDALEHHPEIFIRGNIELVFDGKKIEVITYFAADKIEYESLELLEEFV